MNTVALRPAAPADSELCFQLHKAAMGDYVAAIWGWDDEDQHAYHVRGFDPIDGRSSPSTGPTRAYWSSSTARSRSTWGGSNSIPTTRGEASVPSCSSP